MKRCMVTAMLLVLGRLAMAAQVPVIGHDSATAGPALLAVKELQRYLYARTGVMPQVRRATDARTLPANAIFVTTRPGGELTDQSFQLRSLPGPRLLIVGGSPIATLYGVYKFLETTGIGFAPDEDIIPEQQLPAIDLMGFDSVYRPAFELRGILPFHDFPEGPDWWNEDDYKAIITQLPKMGMNFIGMHTYPSRPVFGGWYKAEPVVWLGTGEQFDTATGKVSAAYPVLHAHTADSTWNYYPKPATDFSFGAAQLFETADYGADYMKNRSPWPHAPAENIDIFNAVGTMLNHAFSLARDLGIKTCLGTESPLSFPGEVRQALLAEDRNIHLEQARSAVYEAAFSRIKSAHPLDYYWLWTPEDWTWSGERPGEADAVEADLLGAVAAAAKVRAPFTIATCGWVLGPARNRAEFDRVLPKNIPFGVINRQQGYAPVEPAFGEVHGRPTWEISWLEDDPALICPQFWAGRVLKDASDAYRYGCTGLMGIHWRMKILSPAFTALAKAGWEAARYDTAAAAGQRDYPAKDLYDRWAKLQFGEAAASRASRVFQALDGAPVLPPNTIDYVAHFPRAAVWGEKGPGMVVADKTPWSRVEPEYHFIAEFEACGPLITGAGERERYNYWLQTFYYAKGLAKTGCLLGQMDTLAFQIARTADTGAKRTLAGELLAARDSAAVSWGEMVTHLLQTVSTTGEMGTIANLEQHNMEGMRYLTRCDSLLGAALGEKVTPVFLSKAYKGPSRLVMTTKRTLLHVGEDLNFRVRVLTAENVSSISLFWKRLGSTAPFTRTPIDHEAANVFSAHLSSNAFGHQDMEYYVEVTLSTGQVLKYPVGVSTTQTVVVW